MSSDGNNWTLSVNARMFRNRNRDAPNPDNLRHRFRVHIRRVRSHHELNATITNATLGCRNPQTQRSQLTLDGLHRHHREVKRSSSAAPLSR